MNRKFVKKLLVPILAGALFLSSCGKAESASPVNLRTAMGTVFLFSPGIEEDERSDALFKLAVDLDRDFLSKREAGAEIARINEAAGREDGYPLSEEMEKLLKSCLILSKESEGAFDITVGALTKLWDLDAYAAGEESPRRGEKGEYIVPTEEEIAEALTHCGYEKVRIADHRVYIPEGMILDLGSVGKGYYLNRVMELAVEAEAPTGTGTVVWPEGSEDVSGNDVSGNDVSGNDKFSSASVSGNDSSEKGSGLPDLSDVEWFTAWKWTSGYTPYAPDTEKLNASAFSGTISAGGSVLTLGTKEGGEPWNVGIIDPFGAEKPADTISLEGWNCVSTSGDYERYAESNGVRYHHIIDPRTGYPAWIDKLGYYVPDARRPVSVTVVSPDGFLSDALSTACFVLGEEKGRALAESYGAEVRFIYGEQ